MTTDRVGREGPARFLLGNRKAGLRWKDDSMKRQTPLQSTAAMAGITSLAFCHRNAVVRATLAPFSDDLGAKPVFEAGFAVCAPAPKKHLQAG